MGRPTSRVRPLTVGYATAWAARRSYMHELGWELMVPSHLEAPNTPANAETGMIKNDLSWIAENRDRILAERSKRHGSKAPPKN